MKCLIVRHNGLGDLIMTLPIINALKRIHNCQVDYMTTNGNRALIARFPKVTEFKSFEPSPLSKILYTYHEETIKNSKVDGYDLVLNMNDILEISDNFKNPGKYNQTEFMAEYYNIELTTDDFDFSIITTGLSNNDFGDYILLALDSTSMGRTLHTRHEIFEEIPKMFNQKFIMISRNEGIVNRENLTQVQIPNQNALLSICYNAKAIISTDNGMVHLGGIFEKKTLAIYSCIKPFQRTKYYKTITHTDSKCPFTGPIGLHNGCETLDCMKLSYKEEIINFIKEL